MDSLDIHCGKNSLMSIKVEGGGGGKGVMVSGDEQAQDFRDFTLQQQRPFRLLLSVETFGMLNFCYFWELRTWFLSKRLGNALRMIL